MVVRERERVELPDDVEALKRIVAERTAEVEQLRAEVQRLEHNVRLLTKWAFEPRSERRPSQAFDARDAQQGWLLFPEILQAAERVADETGQRGEVEIRSSGSKPKRNTRRKKFPAHLPVLRSTFELPDDERTCPCGAALAEMGEDVSRELERLELTVVHEIARRKYACRSCGVGVRTAPGPDRVIDKGLLGVGFLAHVITERFGNHMPYHRLERKYASEGLELSRSVLWRSTHRCAELLEPVYEQLKRDVLASPVIQTDDTPVTLAHSSTGIRRQSRVWIYRGLDGSQLYDFTESRSRDGPARILAGFDGYLQADAYPGYDAFYRPDGATEVACWAHARRKYVEAEPTDPTLAQEAVRRIGELYAIEKRAKEVELGVEELRDLRQHESLPRLESLRDWLTATRPQVLDKSPMGRAIDYTLAQWRALCRYTEDGRLSIDNNAAERSLRQVAVGRKNWLFLGNDKGGRTAAILYSLLMTAKEIGVDPRIYLRDVLLRLARETDVRKLTPHGWQQHFADEVEAHRLSILERMLEVHRRA